MKRRFLTTTAAFAALIFTASAATIFNNGNATNLVTDVDNWDNGLPTGANQGTININASADSDVSLSGYNVVQTGGVFSHTKLAAVSLIDSTTWQINGASASTNASFRGFNVRSGSDFTLTAGTVNTTSGRDWALGDTGSTLTVNGGSINFGRSLVMQGTAGAIFTMNAGTAQGSGSIGGNNIQDNTHTLNFNGGTTTFGNLDLRGDNTFFNFGGTTVGSLTATTLNTGGTFGSNSLLDWFGGSQMSLTITGADQTFYENLYTAGDLVFEGSNANTFASNFKVSGSTLSLIPEPSSMALFVLGFTALVGRRRRNA